MFPAKRALATTDILLRRFRGASARVVTLATAVGTGIFPGLLFCVEILGFLPDVLARRDIFEWIRPLLKLVGRRKETRERGGGPDLGMRNFRFLG